MGGGGWRVSAEDTAGFWSPKLLCCLLPPLSGLLRMGLEAFSPNLGVLALPKVSHISWISLIAPPPAHPRVFLAPPAQPHPRNPFPVPSPTPGNNPGIPSPCPHPAQDAPRKFLPLAHPRDAPGHPLPVPLPTRGCSWALHALTHFWDDPGPSIPVPSPTSGLSRQFLLLAHPRDDP